MRCAKAILGLAVLGLSPSLVRGQSAVDILIQEGDTVIGLGELVNLMPNLYITDSRMWATLVSTSFPTQTRDGCLLRNGFVTLREGMSLFSPAGTTLDEWSSIAFNNSGELGMALKLVPRQGDAFTGAFFNLIPVALEGGELVAPEVPPGTIWDKFDVVKLTDSNTMYILGEIDNPDLPRLEDVLVRYQLSPMGEILSTTVLATEGMCIPALGDCLFNPFVVSTLGNTEHLLAANNRGDFITMVVPTPTSGGEAVVLNMETILAQKNAPAPVPGRFWFNLQLTKVAINDRGDHAFTGGLNPEFPNQITYLLVKNGEKFVQAGDIIPGFSSFPLAQGSPAPIALTNAGDLFWRASSTSGGDAAFLRNLDVLVARNRTIVSGTLVTEVSGDEHSFAVSPEGRFFVGRVELQGVGNAVLFIDFGLVKELPGCIGNPGKLSRVSGEARVGQRLQLGMDDAQAVGALPVLLFSRQPRIPGSECGANTRFGEVFISPTIVGTFFLPTWDGVNPSVLDINIPSDVSLVDAVFYGQGVFRDTPRPPTFSLTNGLRIEIGAP